MKPDDSKDPGTPKNPFGSTPTTTRNIPRRISVPVDTDSVPTTNNFDEKSPASLFERRESKATNDEVPIPMRLYNIRFGSAPDHYIPNLPNANNPALMALDLEAVPGEQAARLDDPYVNETIKAFLKNYEVLRNHKWGTLSEKILGFLTPKRGRFNDDQEIVDLLNIALKAQPRRPFFPPKWSAHRYDKRFLGHLLQEYIDSLPRDGTATNDIVAATTLRGVLSKNTELQEKDVTLLKAILLTAAESRQQQHLNKAVRGLAKADKTKRAEFFNDPEREKTFKAGYKVAFGITPPTVDEDGKIAILMHKNNQITVPNNNASHFKNELLSFVDPRNMDDPKAKLEVRKLTPKFFHQQAILNTLRNDPNVLQLENPSVFRIEHQEQTYFVFAAPHPGYKNAPPPIAWVVRQKDEDGHHLQEVQDTRAKQACIDKFMGRLSTHLATKDNPIIMCTSEPHQTTVSAQAVHENTKKLNSLQR